MGNLIIRRVKKNEIDLLSDIGSKTFIDTYSEYNTETDMKNYLSENFSLDSVRTQFENQDSFFYFAELENNNVGYIKLNKGAAQTESKLENALEIERIYVVKGFQGKRIGNQLLQQSIETGKSLGLSTLWLGVWDRNVKAIEFYLKNGFVEFAQHSFMLGSDLQNDAMMKLDLT